MILRNYRIAVADDPREKFFAHFELANDIRRSSSFTEQG